LRCVKQRAISDQTSQISSHNGQGLGKKDRMEKRSNGKKIERKKIERKKIEEEKDRFFCKIIDFLLILCFKSIEFF
jgi:hypothetical protein